MAQLLLMGAQLACGLPAAKVVGPIIASVIPVSPLNIITYVVWLLVLKLSGVKWTKALAPTWKKAALWALVIYFATDIPLYAIIFLFLCKTADVA